jgi:hypothetical protein
LPSTSKQPQKTRKPIKTKDELNFIIILNLENHANSKAKIKIKIGAKKYALR